MEAFRAPPSRAHRRADQVEAANDYQAQRRQQGGATQQLALPKSNVLAWELAGGSRVTLRPSGTEPKIKVYFEWRESLTAGEPMACPSPKTLAARAA